MTTARTGRWAFLRMLSGAVAVQALISASNFAVGLLLVRRTTQAQYGYYVLITTAILLATTLQAAFIQPPMVVRLTRSTKPKQAAFIGGLHKDQRKLVLYASALMATAALILGFSGTTWPLLAMLVFGAAAVATALHRNFFRMVLFAYRLPEEVLRSDFFYCVFLIAGAFVATLTPEPAAAAALVLAISSFIGGYFLSRTLWRHEPWDPRAPTGSLREIAPDGAWSAFGGGVHWLFSQGYTYLVAATIDVSTVAALSATRLFTTPVALLSVGIGTLMLPTTSKWNNDLKPLAVLGRLALFSIGLDVLASIYFLGIWYTRGWLFDHVLKRHFAQGDLLLLVWFAIALVTVFRDQLLYFLVTRSRFKATSTITLISAIISLSASFILMRHIGGVGASIGLLLGETLSAIGILLLSLLEAKRASSSPQSPSN